MGLAGIVNKNVDRTAGFSNFVEEAGGRSLLTEISDEGPAVNAVGRELVSCLLQQVFSLPAGNDKIVSGGTLKAPISYAGTFSDAGLVSDYAVPAMRWANVNGIITGKPGGLLDPLGGATRAEFAVMISRFVQL